MVDRKYISLTIIIHEPAKCLQTHYFAKFLFIRLTELPTQQEQNGGKFLSLFNPFDVF